MENQGRRLALAFPPCLELAGEEGTVCPLTQVGPPVLKTFPTVVFGKHRRPVVPAAAKQKPSALHSLLPREA